jgi:hypothetical protein
VTATRRHAITRAAVPRFAIASFVHVKVSRTDTLIGMSKLEISCCCGVARGLVRAFL